MFVFGVGLEVWCKGKIVMLVSYGVMLLLYDVVMIDNVIDDVDFVVVVD